DQARPFTAADMFAPSTRLFAIPESSSRFMPGDRVHARAATGLYGDPCVLWVGRLTRGKDPLTVLEGIALAASRLPACACGAPSGRRRCWSRCEQGSPTTPGWRGVCTFWVKPRMHASK